MEQLPDGLCTLWQAVLNRAIYDIVGKIDPASEVDRKPDKKELIIRNARAWASSKGEDFRQVCEFAGYDPSYVHGKIAKLIMGKVNIPKKWR